MHRDLTDSERKEMLDEESLKCRDLFHKYADMHCGHVRDLARVEMRAATHLKAYLAGIRANSERHFEKEERRLRAKELSPPGSLASPDFFSSFRRLMEMDFEEREKALDDLPLLLEQCLSPGAEQTVLNEKKLHIMAQRCQFREIVRKMEELGQLRSRLEELEGKKTGGRVSVSVPSYGPLVGFGAAVLVPLLLYLGCGQKE